jgi:hypothetical protein
MMEYISVNRAYRPGASTERGRTGYQPHQPQQLRGRGRSTRRAKPALTLGKGAVSLLAELGTIAALVILLLLEGPKIRAAVLGLMSLAGALQITVRELWQASA